MAHRSAIDESATSPTTALARSVLSITALHPPADMARAIQ
jgi:hypothetical protein